jgi:hypothetical protein
MPRRPLPLPEGVILKMCHGTHGGPHTTSVLDDTDVGRASMKDLTGRRRRGGDTHENEGDADTFHRGKYPQIHRK